MSCCKHSDGEAKGGKEGEGMSEVCVYTHIIRLWLTSTIHPFIPYYTPSMDGLQGWGGRKKRKPTYLAFVLYAFKISKHTQTYTLCTKKNIKKLHVFCLNVHKKRKHNEIHAFVRHATAMYAFHHQIQIAFVEPHSKNTVCYSMMAMEMRLMDIT